MRNISFLFWILLLVNGVSGVEELQLMVGDSVTLKSAVMPSKETIQWLFGKTRIAEINGSSLELKYKNVTDFNDRLELDKETGSLTIKNINFKHSGQYKQYIANIININKTIKVKVEQTLMETMEGDPVTLFADVPGVRKDQIQWTFRDQPCNTDDQSGNLNLTNLKKSQAGIYKLKIITDSMILHRRFNVTVNETNSGVSPGAEAGIVVGLLVFHICLQL